MKNWPYEGVVVTRVVNADEIGWCHNCGTLQLASAAPWIDISWITQRSHEACQPGCARFPFGDRPAAPGETLDYGGWPRRLWRCRLEPVSGEDGVQSTVKNRRVAIRGMKGLGSLNNERTRVDR